MIFPKDAVERLKELMEKLSEDNKKLHDDLLKKIVSDARTDLEEIDQDDIEIFHFLVKAYHLGFLTKEQKKDILAKLDDLHKRLKQTKGDIIELGENYGDINALINVISDFLMHEAGYLDYSPGAQKREYVRFIELLDSPEKKLMVDKAVLEVVGNQIYYDGKIVQGVEITGKSVEIVGQHYSDRDSIMRIYNNREMDSEGEPYCYMVEPGKLAGKSENEIKKILGARNADSNITVKVSLQSHMCWIRVHRGFPAKFAIEARKIHIAPPKQQKGFRIEIEGKVQWAA